MRILIDARMMGPENSRGIGRYTEELVRAMLEIAPEHRYVLVSRTASHAFADHPSVETCVADVPWYGFAEQIRMPAIFRSLKADVIHVPHWNVPLFCPGPLVITVHDLLLRHTPSSAKLSTRNILTRTIKRFGYRFALDHAFRAAKKILVPTDFVAQDMLQFYPQVAGKLVTTGEGMPELHLPTGERVVGQPPYLLYVGSAYPHKGLADLLAAWPKIAAAYPKLELKLGGELDVFMQRYKLEAEAQRLPRISFLGRVKDADLPKLYQQATAFVFPSHFEGFGLPPLEAISYGCPVISSDAPALTEVLGKDAAIFFRRGDPDAILSAVHELIRDPQQASRNMREAATGLVRRHDWKRAAQLTLDAYGRTKNVT